MLRVKEFMTPNVVTIHKDSTVMDAARLLKVKSVSGLVVVDNDRPVGMITERDIVHFIAQDKEPKAQVLSTIMSKPVTFIRIDDTLDTAVNLMTKTRFKRVPVVDDHRVVGIMSQSDVIKNFVKVGHDLQNKLESGEITESEFAKRHKAIFNNLERVEAKKAMVSWHMRCMSCSKTFFVDELEGKLVRDTCPYCQSTSMEHVK